ncbi:hypothetical protein [Streptomyces sp. NPDC006879]|uniref:hypothetical protein n=1 Tax=Streptomyces sp. NPDC006879 TaxID=3364767 RepID=UPI0036D05CA6
MVVTLIIACEVGFWVFLVLGLALRYLARKPRWGAAVLLCEPVLEIVLLVATALDLKSGAEPDGKHGLAALYLGYTAAYGHYTITWLDAHAAHRLAGGPKPAGAGHGRARAVHEWRLWARTLLAVLVACGLLQGAIWYVGEAGDTGSLTTWQRTAVQVLVLHALIAVGYTVWPKKAPAAKVPDPG